MSSYDIIPVAGVGILLITVIVFQRLRYRSSVKDRNRGIIQLISEQMRLARELERALFEKETLEKIVKRHLNDTASNRQWNPRKQGRTGTHRGRTDCN